MRRRRNVAPLHVLLTGEVEQAMKNLLKEQDRHEFMVPPSDSTLSWVEKILNPGRSSMLEDVAVRLTKLFKSEDFTHANFPEVPERHIKRLRWVAKSRGFKSLQEILVVVARSNDLKVPPELFSAKLEELAADERQLPRHVLDVIEPLARAVGRELEKQERLLKRQTHKAHRGSLYTNKTVMIWDGSRMRFEQSFAAPSLMEAFVTRIWGEQDQPVSFQIINIDPEHNPIPDRIVRDFNNMGILVIKEKAGVPILLDSVPMEERAGYMAKLVKDIETDHGNETVLDWEEIRKFKDLLTPGGKALLALFDKSIDATYVPSIVTSPIEPESFRKTEAVVTDCCDYQGNSLEMDGGGWLPPFYDGKPQVSQQIRGVFPLTAETCAYAKGMGFVKWDCAMWRDMNGESRPWYPLWIDSARQAVCKRLEVTEEQFRQMYWETASACTKGYPEFHLNNKVEFKMLPVLDIDQIKGKTKDDLKSKVSQELVMMKGYMGALRIEGGYSTMDSCFESLMWMNYDPNEVADENGEWVSPARRAIHRHQLELAEKLADEGLDGLAARASNQDEGIAMMLKVLGAFNQVRLRKNAQAQKIEWFMIPTLRARIWRSLEKIIYQGADGGGISAPQVVFQMSSTVPEGTCVYPMAKPGDQVACYRFPMSTHTAMTVTQAQNPANYPELWTDPWGATEDTRMVMNPRDLNFRMQGDDDGDRGGATTDPDIVAMALDTWEHRLVNIEVRLEGAKGSKYNESMWDVRQIIPMDEDGNVVYNPKPGIDYPFYTSGMELAARSRRGQVGRTTRLQQRLHALMWRWDPIQGRYVRDQLMGERAIAMAWPNQGEIDIEKKLIQRLKMQHLFSLGLFGRQIEDDFRPGALAQDDDGVWHVRPGLIIKNPGGYDVKSLGNLITNDYVIGSGCFVYDLTKVVDEQAQFPHGCARNPGDPIEWCRSDKRIDLMSSNWQGARSWGDSGLRIDSIMHWSFRNMEEIWNSRIKASFQMPQEITDFDFGNVLAEVLTLQGKKIKGRTGDWYNNTNYQLLRTKCGVEDYRKSMRDSFKVVAGEETDDVQQNVRAQAALRQQLKLLELPLQDYADLWRLENWKWNSLMERSDEQATLGNASESTKFRKAAEGCINSMVRLINFKESPVAILLGVSETEECGFLPKEELDELTTWCYRPKSRRETFDRLTQWVKANGHKHSQVMNDRGDQIHMVDCPVCMAKAKQSLISRFRADSSTVAGQYFRELTTKLNKTKAGR